MVNIKGATVVVTGGQRGLGKAIVDAFLQAGAAKVYATARAPKPSEDSRVVSVELDVTRADSVAALAITASDADIVVWSGDPLEVSTLADQVWIAGRPVEMKARQTELRDRYVEKVKTHQAR